MACRMPLLALALASCGDRVDLSALDAIDLHVETLLSEEAATAASAPPYRVVAGAESGIVLVDPLADAPEVLAALDAEVVGAGRLDDLLVIATADDLWLWADGTLTPVGVGPSVAGALVEVRQRGDALWLRAEGGLYRLQDDALVEVRAGGMALPGPVAPGGQLDGAEVTWASGPGGVVALGADLQVVWSDRELVATSLAVDATGALWAVAEEALTTVSTDGAAQRVELGEAVRAAYAHPGAEGAWITTLDRVVWDHGGAMQVVDGRIYDAAADELGRLLVPGPFALERYTAGRAVAVLGLEDGDVLAQDAVITLAPTDPDDVTAASVDVDGTAVDVDLATLTATVDASLVVGDTPRTVRVDVTWADGGTASSPTLSVSAVSVGTATWVDDVQPLYQDRCSICHSGDTETQLDTAEAWEARIDDILDNVISGAMPIGGPVLTEGEVAIITAWRDGGFP